MKKETREEDGKKKLEITTISLRYRGNERNISDNQIRMNNIRVLMHAHARALPETIWKRNEYDIR